MLGVGQSPEPEHHHQSPKLFSVMAVVLMPPTLIPPLGSVSPLYVSIKFFQADLFVPEAWNGSRLTLTSVFSRCC